MDDIRLGRVLRALRRRRGWRQDDLARAATVGQSTISLIERGHLGSLSLRTIRRVFAPLEATVHVEVRWRGADLDRLLDERHALLSGLCSTALVAAGWDVQPEVTYARFGERGSIDLVAWHAPTASLLVVEVKSELVSVEATLRKLDEKVRLAPLVVRERYDWTPSAVSRALVLPASSTEHARVRRAGTSLARALPGRTIAVRRWLARPTGELRAMWFVHVTNRGAGKSGVRSPRRVRVTRRAHPPVEASTSRAPGSGRDASSAGIGKLAGAQDFGGC